MKNIYLIGMPGCGKSTVGRQICRNLNLEFKDLDEFICQRENKSIDALFENGEAFFRDAETAALKAASALSNTLIATGGGIVCRDENEEIMKKSGTVIFINTDVNDILKNSALDGRPLLKNKDAIYDLYNARIEKYRRFADFTVDNNSSFEDVCENSEKIIRNIK